MNSQDEKCFKLLIKSGSDVNIEVSDKTSTPLHFAVKFSPLNFVKVLLENGAKFDIIPKNQFFYQGELFWNWP